MSGDAPTPQLVTSLLRAHVDDGLTAITVTGGAVGNGQETWFVDAEDSSGAPRRFVIRRSAAAGTQVDTDRELEYRVLEFLAQHDFPVPAVHWLETQPSVLERPFFVMDRLPGRDPGRLDEPDRRAVARELGAWLARLHALELDRAPAALGSAAGSVQATRLELERWTRNYALSRPGPMPLLGALLGWLEVQAPRTGPPACLVWGDPGPHNVLAQAGRMTGLLDWEQAHLGHPLEDVGAAMWACLDLYEPADVLAGYESNAGAVDREAVRYFEVFAAVKWTIMIAGGVTAYIAGLRTPTRAALGQHLLLRGLRHAAVAAGWDTPPAPAVEPAPRSPLRLRPDGAELAKGVARFLTDDVAPALGDRGLRAQLRTAVALLETIAVRADLEGPLLAQRREALEHLIPGGGPDELEALAATAERTAGEQRPALRAHLLADLAAHERLIGPLEELYRPRR